MRWKEFKALISGLSSDTPLGTVVRIRAEEDREVLKNFTPEQHRIRNEWRKKIAGTKSENELNQALEQILKAFKEM